MNKQTLLLLLAVFCNMQMYATDLYGDESNVISLNTVNAVVSFSAVGDNPWYWSSYNNYLRSTSIGNDEASEIELSINVPEDACMSFDFLISSEDNYDYATIKLDGETIVHDCGVQSGKSESFLSPGSHTLLLNYHKDAEDSDNQDMAAISNLKFEKKSEWESIWSENVGKVLYQNSADASIAFVNHSTKPKYAWVWSGSGKRIQSSDKYSAISEMDIVINAKEEVVIDFNYTIDKATNPLIISIDGETVVTSYNASSTNFRDTLSVGQHTINLYYKNQTWSGDTKAYISMFAVYSTCIAKGTCNENIKWVIDKDGTLEITGSGEMPDYTSVNYTVAPWYNRRSSIKKIVIGEGVTRVGNDAVIQCPNLTEVSIANTVTSMGKECFMENFNLSSITLSENIQNIGEYAFSNCYKIEEVVLPSIVSISSAAFVSCTGMKSLVLGNTINSIQADAFGYCTGLETVYCNKKTPAEINTIAFHEIPANCKLYVPVESSILYSNAEGWNVFNIVGVENGDVNLDQKVNVTDAVEIVNNVVGEASERFEEAWSDVNSDNQYTIADAMAVVNIILGEEIGASYAMNYAPMADNDYLSLYSTNSSNMTLAMDNMQLYSSFQFDVNLPEGITLENVTLNQNRCQDFSVMFREMEEGRWTVAVYNFGNEPFATGSGALVNMSISGSGDLSEATVSNIHFSTTRAVDVQFNNLSLSDATGVECVDLDVDSKGNDSIYDLSGRRLESVKKGVNIIGGKKVVVK